MQRFLTTNTKKKMSNESRLAGYAPNDENLKKRRGIVKFVSSIANNPTESKMRAIFHNFFPFAIESDHSFCMYGGLIMYGFSPHFREVEENEEVPEYAIWFKVVDDLDQFDKMVEKVK